MIFPKFTHLHPTFRLLTAATSTENHSSAIFSIAFQAFPHTRRPQPGKQNGNSCVKMRYRWLHIKIIFVHLHHSNENNRINGRLPRGNDELVS